MPIHSKVIAEEEASADGQTARSFQSSNKSSVRDDEQEEAKSSPQREEAKVITTPSDTY